MFLWSLFQFFYLSQTVLLQNTLSIWMWSQMIIVLIKLNSVFAIGRRGFSCWELIFEIFKKSHAVSVRVHLQWSKFFFRNASVFFPISMYIEMFVLHQIRINFMSVNLLFRTFASILFWDWHIKLPSVALLEEIKSNP